jgi:prepilin-type processing-associated H-X9-DG protein
MYATLGEYTKSHSLYLCPSSIALAPVNTSFSPLYSLCRTVAMNCWMGYNSPSLNSAYQEFGKITSISEGITPASAFVFIEERAESINAGYFETEEGNITIANWPGNYHNNGACSVSFADGHVESHSWHNTATSVSPWSFLTPQAAINRAKWGSTIVPGSQAGDLTWLQLHATCLK